MLNDIRYKIENYLNGIDYSFTTIQEKGKGAYSNFYFNCAKRMCYQWNQFQKGIGTHESFEITLRDFLLLDNKPIKILNYSLSQFGKQQLGLSSEAEGIIVAPSFPKWTNFDFVKRCYALPNKDAKDDNRFLKTSPYIAELTKRKYYKSSAQQYAVIGSLNLPKGYTELLSLPTGAGKSMVTQALAYQNKTGLSIVVVPTISLMLDQVKQARALLVPKNSNEILCYNSTEDVLNVCGLLKSGVVRLLYLSPEALFKNNKLGATIEEINKQHKLKNLIIDEAHIIVEWGSEFRVDFQCLEVLRMMYLDNNPELRTYLMSATFSNRTVELLKRVFSKGDDWIEIRCDAMRKEPQYLFHNIPDKAQSIYEAIFCLPHPMIVYVESPKEANQLAAKLNNDFMLRNVRTFTGLTCDSERKQLLYSWANDEFEIMVATCAFGVGVDKPDVRTVLHLYVPDNPNKFYQEAGRGGRDGLPCLSVLLYTSNDVDRAFKMTTKVITTEKLLKRWFCMVKKASFHADRVFTVNTSVKPNYEDENDGFDYANEKDVNWNVNVLLLLKRYGKIDISKVTFENSVYYFEIKCIDMGLLTESPETQLALEEIREKEWKANKDEFEKMKHMIVCSETKQCVSDVLREEFPLADFYCAGCNAHSNVKTLSEKKVLKSTIALPPEKNPINLPIDPASKKNLVFVIGSEPKRLEKWPLSSLILSECHTLQTVNLSYYTNVYSMTDFLSGIDFYYLGYNVGVLLPEDDLLINSILRKIQDIQKENPIRFILFAKEDKMLFSLNKRLTELVECEVYQDYLI